MMNSNFGFGAGSQGTVGPMEVGSNYGLGAGGQGTVGPMEVSANYGIGGVEGPGLHVQFSYMGALVGALVGWYGAKTRTKDNVLKSSSALAAAAIFGSLLSRERAMD